MERIKIRFRSAILRDIASILTGLVLGGCGVVLIGSPTFKENLRPILIAFAAFLLLLIVLLIALRVYLRRLTSSWSASRFRDLVNSATRFVFVAEEREASKEKLAAEVSEGASLLMSVMAVAQAMAALLVFLGTFVAVATLATSYMQVERLDAQNSLIAAQNAYFQEQIKELRRQVEIQDEQGDLVRRKDLLETIYDGKERGVSTRVRVEALKALVRLDNKLIDQGAIPGPVVDLRGVDFSCEEIASGCADFSRSWLVRTDFSGSRFKGASFLGADLRDSYFISADLSSVNLKFAQLEGVQFREILPVFLWGDLERGRMRSAVIPGLTEGMFQELLSARIPAEDMHARARIIRQEFALERFPASEALVSLLNAATKAADVRNAEFSFAWIKGRLGRPLGQGEYKHADVYTRIPFGIAVPQGKDEGDLYDRLDRVQLKADELFGLYKVNIDSESGFPIRAGDTLVCYTVAGSGRLKVRLDEYEKMSPSEQEKFILRLCKLDARRMRGSLPFP